jgi:membrane protease YdiL (CAAX protease family)
MISDAVPVTALHRDTEIIDNRVPVSIVTAGLPVPLAILFGVGYEMLTGTTAETTIGQNIAYGVASVLVVGGVYWLLSARERAAVFRFERPSSTELTWTLVSFPLGVGTFLGASAVAGALGFEMGGYEYTLSDPVTAGAVVFGAVLVAPFAEEVLFRGFVLGSLLGRGWSPVVAGGVAILAFGLLHVALLGIAGVIAMVAWSVFPTMLRLRFNNLTGAWMLHLVNNIWAYLGVVALGLA